MEGAPAGVKGISLFVVPKMKLNPDDSIAGSNDVHCGGVEKKLGLHKNITSTKKVMEKIEDLKL